MMRLDEVQKNALELPEAERAWLAAEILSSLPCVLVDADDGVAEAVRRSKELDQDESLACNWEGLKREIGR